MQFSLSPAFLTQNLTQINISANCCGTLLVMGLTVGDASASTPEPAGELVMGMGLSGAGLLRRRARG